MDFRRHGIRTLHRACANWIDRKTDGARSWAMYCQEGTPG